MANMRIAMIAAGLLVLVLTLVLIDVPATAFGLVMLGGALLVAITMFFITRHRNQRMTESEKQDRDPPRLS